MKIKLFEILGSKSAIFHAEGLEIFKSISSSLACPEVIELSFEGIENCSTQFLNATIGKAYVNFKYEIVDEYLKIINYDQIPFFKEKLSEVINNAKNSEEFDKIYENAVGY